MMTALEAAEICSKILDWKVKRCSMGEDISRKYLIYVEELGLYLRAVLEDDLISEEYLIRA